MYKYTVARRYMLKRPISYVVILLVAFVVMMYIVVISVLEGFKSRYMDEIQSGQAHITVNVGQYAWGIERPREWSEEMSKVDPGIKGITVGLETPSMVVLDSARTIGTLRGVDLREELKTGRMGESIVPANLNEFGMHESGGRKMPGCIIGGSLKQQFNLKIGGRISFIFSDEEDEPRTIAAHVVGFFEGKNSHFDHGAYIDRSYLAEKIKVPGRAKTMYFWLSNPNREDLAGVGKKIGDKMRAILQRDHPEMIKKVNVETWKEKDNHLYKLVSMENIMMRTIMAIFLALTAFIMFLIFGRLVAEKVRDIGALRALGASPAGIMNCFLIQGLLIGALGLILGLGMSEILLRNMNELMLFLGLNLFPASDRIPHVTLPWDRVLITVLTLASALFGALWPAWRAARLNPVECLRHE